jgi:hypothetical protein
LHLLREHGFEASVTRKTRSIFPPDIDAWVQRVEPHVSTITAARA